MRVGGGLGWGGGWDGEGWDGAGLGWGGRRVGGAAAGVCLLRPFSVVVKLDSGDWVSIANRCLHSHEEEAAGLL